jgi:hypothetical protein
LKDQAKIDFAQMNKLRVFVDYIPIPGFPSWKKLTALYGEAIGIEETIVSKEINDREASVRFEGGLKTSSNRPRILRKLSERGTVVITSTGISEKAYAVKELGGSVFGHYFNEALAGRAANAAGIVTAYSAFDYVQEHMRDAFKQSPSFQSHGTNMVDFPLTGGNPSLQSGGKRRALLLATDTYLDQNIPSLFGGQTQLWRTAELLRTSGAFAVSLLVGDQMTRTNLTSELIRLSDEAGPDDCLLFYFAGHANIVDDNMYLIFSDSRLGEPLSYLSTIELNNSLQRSGNASLIVVLDTSYAGSAVAAFE